MAAYPGTLFVQRDFIRAFFGEIPDLGTDAWPLTQSPESQAQSTPRRHQTDSDTSSNSHLGTPHAQSTLGLNSDSDMTDQPRETPPSGLFFGRLRCNFTYLSMQTVRGFELVTEIMLAVLSL
jgi:hypothetical protein